MVHPWSRTFWVCPIFPYEFCSSLSDSASAITLRRELLEAIGNKHVQRSTQDDFKWPGIDIALETLGLESKRSLFIQPNLTPLKPFWSNVSSEYQSQSFNPERFAASKLQSLPKSWTIVHISVTFDQSTLFISRQRGGEEQQPLVFCIPLKGRREGSGDEDEHLTFEDAISELSEIIHSSNETTKVAVNIKDQAARAEWWKQRKTLDTRLHDLLENIEFCWLGAFKVRGQRPSGMRYLNTLRRPYFLPHQVIHQKPLKSYALHSIAFFNKGCIYKTRRPSKRL